MIFPKWIQGNQDLYLQDWFYKKVWKKIRNWNYYEFSTYWELKYRKGGQTKQKSPTKIHDEYLKGST